MYEEADKVFTALSLGAFDIVYPVYFGPKDELTDERGVFDVAKAEELVDQHQRAKGWS